MIRPLKTCTRALLVAAAIFAGSMALETSHHASAAQAMPDRPAAQIARDAGRKPKEVMAYLDIKPGMKIWDHASATGYYTTLFSEAVGPIGKVYAQISERGWERLRDGLEPRYEMLGNVEPAVTSIQDFEGKDGTLDMVFLGLIYHHMHYSENAGNGRPARASVFFDKAFRLLKPGGILVVIDHQAPNGTRREDSAEWHRATLQNAVDDVTSSGFELAGTSDILANPNDPQTIHFRELPTGRDSSQRFIAKFRKPN